LDYFADLILEIENKFSPAVELNFCWSSYCGAEHELLIKNSPYFLSPFY